MASSKFSMKALLDFGRGEISGPRRIARHTKRGSGRLTNQITGYSSVEDPRTSRSPSSAPEFNPAHPGMFSFNLASKELPISLFGNSLVTFACKCEGEMISDILLIGYECPVHQGITTHNHSIYLEALKNEWKHTTPENDA